MIDVKTNDLNTHDLNLGTVDLCTEAMNLETLNLYSDLTFLVSGLKGEKGEKGDTGVGIEKITTEPTFTGRMLQFHYTNGRVQEFGVDDGAKGEKGDKGEQGIQGEKGADGYTPIKGVDYFDGLQGEKGEKGDKGEDGYTPIKGIDYFDGEQGIQGLKGDKGDAGTTDYNQLLNKPTPNNFIITEDMLTVTTDTTKGVAPYNASYGHTDIVISKDRGIEWVEGATYTFVLITTIGESAYRNGRIKIEGENIWHPLLDASGVIVACYSHLTKANCLYKWTYKTTYQEIGALHREIDNNTTYSYVIEYVPTGCNIVDSKGYGARYTFAFPTTPLSELANERWSSLVASSSTAATKKINTGITKFYCDRVPLYIYSANVAAGAASANAWYYGYNTFDIRYTYNTSATYVSINKRVYLWLKNYNEEDETFEADATVGNIMSSDKISTRFPSTTEGDIYLYNIGWSSSTWYSCYHTFNNERYTIYKYTPSTGKLVGIK